MLEPSANKTHDKTVDQYGIFLYFKIQSFLVSKTPKIMLGGGDQISRRTQKKRKKRKHVLKILGTKHFRAVSAPVMFSIFTAAT